MADSDFQSLWGRIPWVTKHTAAAAALLLATSLLSPSAATLAWRLPDRSRLEVWRWLTAPFSHAGKPLNGVIALAIYCQLLANLETNVFRSRSRTAYYLTWIALFFGVAGPAVGVYAFFPGIVEALTYTLAQEYPREKTFYSVVPLERRFIPVANLVVTFLLSGGVPSSLFLPAIGILAAHSFLFFTELLPQMRGFIFFVPTPRIFRVLDRMEENERRRGQYGSGHKLGKGR